MNPGVLYRPHTLPGRAGESISGVPVGGGLAQGIIDGDLQEGALGSHVGGSPGAARCVFTPPAPCVFILRQGPEKLPAILLPRPPGWLG